MRDCWVDFVEGEHGGIVIDNNEVSIGEKRKSKVNHMFVQLKMYPVEAMVSSGSWNKLDLVSNVLVLLFGLLFQGIIHYGFSKPFAKDI